MLRRTGPGIFQVLGDFGASQRSSTADVADAVRSPTGIQGVPHEGGERVMILCFDGAGGKFGTDNSNVVRFFRALRKDDWENQIVYYQSGTGTSNDAALIKRTISTFASNVDAVIPLDLDDRIKQGYRFIIQNYRPGDKICLFGFSRGAHIARAVAGMIHKVGILPKENLQQLDFAFNIYATTGYKGYKLGQDFKRTFSSRWQSNFSVDFVGVWDTPSAVGILPSTLPYTSVNYSVKKFRHALSLDERRASFRPSLWGELTPEREHELDVDEPVPDIKDVESDGEPNRDNFAYEPPNRDYTDVKEVWFAGTHMDVGGGSHEVTRSQSLSFIPLRWMIKECILCETGILFDLDYLRDDLNFDFDELLEEIEHEVDKQEQLVIRGYEELVMYRDKQSEQAEEAEGDVDKTPVQERETELEPRSFRRHAADILDNIFDQLVIFWWFWWLLEMIPMLYTCQDTKGNWVRRRMCNFGRGRYVPMGGKKVLVHNTVRSRIKRDNTGAVEEEAKDVFKDMLDWTRKKYKPRAHNWGYLEKENIIEYVN